MDLVLNVGGGEVLVIFIAALIILGPERLPKFANDVGKWLTKLRTLTSGVQSEFRDALAADEFKDSLEGMRAVMDLKNQIASELTGFTAAVTSSVQSSVNDAKTAVPSFSVQSTQSTQSTTGGSFYTAPTEWPEPAPAPIPGAFDPGVSIETDARWSNNLNGQSNGDAANSNGVADVGVATPLIPPPDGIFADDVAIDHPMNRHSAGSIPEPAIFAGDILLNNRVVVGGDK